MGLIARPNYFCKRSNTNTKPSIQQDETEYLLSTESNCYQLMTAIQNIETKTNLVSFTLEEWNEEYNIGS